MSGIKIIHQPDDKTLNELGVTAWPIWTKEPSEFLWFYEMEETCYLLEGKVTVTPKDGESVNIEAGDLVTFPQGMSCTWKIHDNVRKHYTFK
ncbi:cupin domain-containing protein [candidate division KSB1 bacterium]|nr:cupin domain-containing protein [candidate division KSB1 bacterium]